MYTRAKYKSSDELDWTKLPDPVSSLKRDGGNFWLSINSEGKPSYISRRPSVKGGYPDRTEALPHLSFTAPELAGHVINVELVHTGHHKNNVDSHSTLSGILNSLPPKAQETQKLIGPVRASMFNVINPEFSNFGEKLEYLKKAESLIGKPDFIFAEPHVHDVADIHRMIEDTKRRGQEGVIITSKTLPESINSRVKVKHVNTFNLLVSDIKREMDISGKYKDSMGALELMDSTGTVVGYVGTGFSRNDRVDAYNNPNNWINHIVQVKTMGFAKNALRMPVYNGRGDGDIDRVVM